VVCLNVVEHVDDDVGALANIRSVLSADGRAIVLVPQGPEVFGTLERGAGPQAALHPRLAGAAGRRRRLPGRAGGEFNRVGRPAWWLNGRLLRRRDFGLLQVMTLNLLTPVFRLVDRALPFERSRSSPSSCRRAAPRRRPSGLGPGRPAMGPEPLPVP